MENFPPYYIRLHVGVTDAIDALLLEKPKDALEILVEAQEDAEEMYLAEMDEAL